MNLKNLKFWNRRASAPTMTNEEWARKVLDDIQTPLVIRAINEAKNKK